VPPEDRPFALPCVCCWECRHLQHSRPLAGTSGCRRARVRTGPDVYAWWYFTCLSFLFFPV